MTRLVADENLKTTLKGLSEEIEICDADGQILGRFLPEPSYARLVYELEPQISEDEIQRRLAEPGGSSLEEIWRRLGRSQ